VSMRLFPHDDSEWHHEKKDFYLCHPTSIGLPASSVPTAVKPPAAAARAPSSMTTSSSASIPWLGSTTRPFSDLKPVSEGKVIATPTPVDTMLASLECVCYVTLSRTSASGYARNFHPIMYHLINDQFVGI